MGEAAIKEPSMEDILASIRKIISEDDKVPGKAEAESVIEKISAEPNSGVAESPEVSDSAMAELSARIEESVAEDLSKAASEQTVSATEPQENGSAASGNSMSELAAALKTGEVVAPEAPVNSPEPDPAPVQTESNPVAASKSMSDLAAALQTGEVVAPEETVSQPEVTSEPTQMAKSESGGNSMANLAAAIQSGEVAIPETIIEPAAVEMAPAEPVIEPEPIVEQEVIIDQEPPANEVVEQAATGAGAIAAAGGMAAVAAAVAMNSENSAETSDAEMPATNINSSQEEKEFRGALMSPSTNASTSEAFERLKRSAMDDIEAKTEAVLRPILREWIDENLPQMVEKLIREEIERVARGGK